MLVVQDTSSQLAAPVATGALLSAHHDGDDGLLGSRTASLDKPFFLPVVLAMVSYHSHIKATATTVVLVMVSYHSCRIATATTSKVNPPEISGHLLNSQHCLPQGSGVEETDRLEKSEAVTGLPQNSSFWS